MWVVRSILEIYRNECANLSERRAAFDTLRDNTREWLVQHLEKLRFEKTAERQYAESRQWLSYHIRLESGPEGFFCRLQPQFGAGIPTKPWHWTAGPYESADTAYQAAVARIRVLEGRPCPP